MHLRHGNPSSPNRALAPTMAVELGSNRGLAVGERRRVLLGEELSGRGGGSWPLTWGRGQWRRAYHSWQYRLTWMPWPRKSKVHMSTFHAGPVRRSCIVKFSGPDAGGRVVSSAPDTCNLSSWLPSYLRAQERVGTGRLRKILSPTPGTQGGLRHSSGFLSYIHFTILAPLLNLPTHTSFLPFVSLYVCPAQILLSSQKCFLTVLPSRIPLCCLPMLPPSQLPSPLPPCNSHRQHYAFPQEACTPPSVLGTWPLPSVWNLQDSSLGMSLQGHTEAKLTSKDKEEQQHDGVEESQDEAEDVLMDHC